MKKILIINNNLDMGGIQKSLVNLLKSIHNELDITLLLFSKSGALLKDVPENVKIITPRKSYCMLGLNRDELKKHPWLFLYKFFLIKYAKRFSRRNAMRLLGMFQKKIRGFDTVISYSHMPHHNVFNNGCGEFVLDKTVCDNKICLIHCDYLNSNCMTQKNNEVYAEFDKIACCSESVKERFLTGSKIVEDKVYTLRNFYDPDIIDLSKKDTYIFDENYVNIVTVARLSAEKGIERAISALADSGRKDIKYYIIGGGPKKEEIESLIKGKALHKQVFLMGEQSNPYRYMARADYLLVPSVHEAAPMVFDEAHMMGLCIITTDTTSAMEMVGKNGGIVCDNSVEGIKEAFIKINKESLKKKISYNNDKSKGQLFELIYN